jgi:uncharacterized SAM-binding protein YcdF (DUF218 family)
VRRFGLLGAGVFLLWVFSESLLRLAGAALVDSETPAPADAIVVLGGDFYGARVIEAADLGQAGFASRVLISGLKPEGRLALRFLTEKGYPRSLFVDCTGDARSTLDEAEAMGPVLKRMGAKRVILVTSLFHTRRAGFLFRALLPQFEFQVVGASDDLFDQNSWWKTPTGRKIVATEWAKLIWNVGFRTWIVRIRARFS